jgi:hypothetical protein
MTEKAKEIVTARGRPSGTAITTTVTPVIKAARKASMVFENSQIYDVSPSAVRFVIMIRPHPRRKATTAKRAPNFARELAIPSNFC